MSASGQEYHSAKSLGGKGFPEKLANTHFPSCHAYAPNSTSLTSFPVEVTVVLYHHVYLLRRSLPPVSVARAGLGSWTTLSPTGNLSSSSIVVGFASSAARIGVTSGKHKPSRSAAQIARVSRCMPEFS